MNIKSKSQI